MWLYGVFINIVREQNMIKELQEEEDETLKNLEYVTNYCEFHT